MEDSTRRNFLILAGAGAAATAGVAAVVTAGGGSTPAPDATVTAALPHGASGALVAYVSDVRSGRISVMVGESEVVVRDPELVARLAAHAAGKKA